MITLAPLDDIDQINQIILNPVVQDDVADDNTIGCSSETIPEGFEVIGVYKDSQLSGLYVLKIHNSITAEIHTCLLPQLRGKLALEAGRQIIDYVFVRFMKLISWVPVNNRKATLYSTMLGFSIEGINRTSYLKNGELLDQYLVGLTKGEYLCQQQQ